MLNTQMKTQSNVFGSHDIEFWNSDEFKTRYYFYLLSYKDSYLHKLPPIENNKQHIGLDVDS